jgi:hypothetical protein
MYSSDIMGSHFGAYAQSDASRAAGRRVPAMADTATRARVTQIPPRRKAGLYLTPFG